MQFQSHKLLSFVGCMVLLTSCSSTSVLATKGKPKTLDKGTEHNSTKLEKPRDVLRKDKEVNNPSSTHSVENAPSKVVINHSREQVPHSTDVKPKRKTDRTAPSSEKFRNCETKSTHPIYGYGSGFFINKNGLVITNAHVVNGANSVEVKVKNKSYKAKIKRLDKKQDVALLQIHYTSTPLELVKSPYMDQGTGVTALGYPFLDIQGRSLKSTFGFINADSGLKDDPSYLQMSAPIQPGNSGGPVINEYGQVVGISTATLNQRKLFFETGNIAQNVNYAVKIEYALKSIKKINLLKAQEALKKMSKVDIVKRSSSSVVLVVSSYSKDHVPEYLCGSHKHNKNNSTEPKAEEQPRQMPSKPSRQEHQKTKHNAASNESASQRQTKVLDSKPPKKPEKSEALGGDIYILIESPKQ